MYLQLQLLNNLNYVLWKYVLVLAGVHAVLFSVFIYLNQKHFILISFQFKQVVLKRVRKGYDMHSYSCTAFVYCVFISKLCPLFQCPKRLLEVFIRKQNTRGSNIMLCCCNSDFPPYLHISDMIFSLQAPISPFFVSLFLPCL